MSLTCLFFLCSKGGECDVKKLTRITDEGSVIKSTLLLICVMGMVVLIWFMISSIENNDSILQMMKQEAHDAFKYVVKLVSGVF